MKNIIVYAVLIFLTLSACKENDQQPGITQTDIDKEKSAIAAMLDSFNVAAGRADYDAYFKHYTNDAIFIGTDATENWKIDSFKRWSKPFFDRGRAWNFSAMQRNIFFGSHPDIAWFDELLNTQMKICRGSGVVVKQDSVWKVQQYVLSMTFPNEKIDDVLPLKATIEDSLMKVIEKK